MPHFSKVSRRSAARHRALARTWQDMESLLETGGTAKICRRSNLQRINSRGESSEDETILKVYPNGKIL